MGRSFTSPARLKSKWAVCGPRHKKSLSPTGLQCVSLIEDILESV